MTKPNTSGTIRKPASLRSDWCSESSRNLVHLHPGTAFAFGGIRTAAAIVDFDTILSDDLNELLSACSVPDASIKGFGQTRGEIRGYVRRGGLDYKRLGLGCLESSEREAAELLIGSLREYGIFVVPVGEVECWLRELNVSAEKSSWVAAMLERLGEGDEATQPGPADVWAFLRNVARWIKANDRKGMPS